MSGPQRFDPSQFVQTVIRFVDDDRWIDLIPEAGTSRGSGDVVIAEPVHVISGCNPGYRESDEVNRVRHMELKKRLRESGVEPQPAIGMAPDGSWVEDSWVVTGLKRAAVCAIGREFGQVAVFEVDAHSIHVVGCADSRVVSSVGYRVGTDHEPGSNTG